MREPLRLAPDPPTAFPEAARAKETHLVQLHKRDSSHTAGAGSNHASPLTRASGRARRLDRGAGRGRADDGRVPPARVTSRGGRLRLAPRAPCSASAVARGQFRKHLVTPPQARDAGRAMTAQPSCTRKPSSRRPCPPRTAGTSAKTAEVLRRSRSPLRRRRPGHCGNQLLDIGGKPCGTTLGRPCSVSATGRVESPSVSQGVHRMSRARNRGPHRNAPSAYGSTKWNGVLGGLSELLARCLAAKLRERPASKTRWQPSRFQFAGRHLTRLARWAASRKPRSRREARAGAKPQADRGDGGSRGGPEPRRGEGEVADQSPSG
jgi:hypothetical protein